MTKNDLAIPDEFNSDNSALTVREFGRNPTPQK